MLISEFSISQSLLKFFPKELVKGLYTKDVYTRWEEGVVADVDVRTRLVANLDKNEENF